MNIKEALKSGILQEFLNLDYLNYENIINIKKIFHENKPKSVKLESIFKKDKYDLLLKEFMKLKFKRNYAPEIYSFSKSAISDEFSKLIKSEEFITFIEFIFDKNIKNIQSQSLIFEHKDYTLLKDDVSESFFEINFFFNNWKEEFGGYFSYFKDEELLRILSTENSATFVHLDKIQKFVKYINVNSGFNKIFFVNLSINKGNA